jgi:hypothetical protein
MTQEETKNLPQTAQAYKVVNPFTRALAPPFIGRRRDFYIPKTPSSSKNIPNVNTYMNVFSSHTFTSLPLVHTLNPDFLRRHLWLCFLLVCESPRSGNLHVPWLSNSSSIILPNFTDSRSSRLCRFMGSSLWLRVFTNSRPRSFAGPRFQAIARTRLRGFESSGLQTTAHSHLRDFASFRLQIHAISLSLKTYSRISWTSTFRGWQVFLNSPTLAPRGSGLTLMIRFHEHFRISVKNVTLKMSEGTRVIRKPRNGRIEAHSQNYPSSPYK